MTSQSLPADEQDERANMDRPVDILHLEDDAADAELVHTVLESAGLTCRITRVQTRDEFGDALRSGGFDVILADFRLPMFDGVSALRMTRELGLDIPFIFVSGTMGEDAAIEGMTQGATDYVLKERLSRLAPAVSRALHDAENRRERKRAEEALQESEARFRSIFESAVVGVTVRDVEGRLLQANPAYERLVGGTVEELRGSAPCRVLHPDDEPYYRQILAEIAAGRRDTFVFEKRLLQKGGAVIWGRVSGSAVKAVDGKPLFIVSMVEDITARKQAEETIEQQLRELQRWYEVTLNREERVGELKREVNQLLVRLGEPARYAHREAEASARAREVTGSDPA